LIFDVPYETEANAFSYLKQTKMRDFNQKFSAGARSSILTPAPFPVRAFWPPIFSMLCRRSVKINLGLFAPPPDCFIYLFWNRTFGDKWHFIQYKARTPTMEKHPPTSDFLHPFWTRK